MKQRNPRRPVSVLGGTFVVVASGFADGPAQPLVRFLNEHGAARVTVLAHPLVAEGPGEHRVEEFINGQRSRRRVLKRPNKPPFTYLFDPVSPFHIKRADAWIGFNCLATGQGLLRRRLGFVRRVIHWNVDFVPQRFGRNAMTTTYEWLDRLCCVRSDGRVELSSAAMDGRIAAYNLADVGCPAEIIPMGSWNQHAPKTSAVSLDEPRIVFLGHIVQRMGLPLLLDVVEILRDRGRTIPVDVVGGGPELPSLRQAAGQRALNDLITWHGFVSDFADVERVLAQATLALAPYETSEDSFSRFADPGKLKAYLGAGLPILLTDVPPNAGDLAERAGARVLPPDAVAFADAIERLVDDRTEWERCHAASLEYAHRFDWETMFSESLPRLGLIL